MNGFSVLMFIFGLFIFLAGLYVYKGHNNELLLWKGYNKNRTKRELKTIGKWLMIISLIIILIGFIGLFLDI